MRWFAPVAIIFGFAPGCGGRVELTAFKGSGGAAATGSGGTTGGSVGLGGADVGGSAGMGNSGGIAGKEAMGGSAGLGGGGKVCPTVATYTDISAGQDGRSGFVPSLVVDATNSKLLVATSNGANSAKPALFRCNLDGSGCTYTDISAGQGSDGFDPSAVIDTINGKLLVVTDNIANAYKPALFRCHLDGTGCTYTDISVGQGANSGLAPSAVIDMVNAKLLVVTDNGANADRPALFRCDLDGSGCTYTDISAGQGIDRGWTPSAVIDMTSAKLLVVTDNLYHRPSLFRCNLDGSGCSYTDISAGQGPGSGYTASAVIDSTNRKLLVATRNASNSGKPALFRCNLDGSGCTYTDISAGRGVDSGWSPSAAIDATNGKLLVVTENGANANKPALFRCNLDGTGCMYTDISVGQGANSGLAPSVVIDMVNGNLLVVTDNGANSDKPGLFTVCLQ